MEMDVKNLFSKLITERGLEDTLKIVSSPRIKQYKIGSYTEFYEKGYFKADLQIKNVINDKSVLIEVKRGQNGGNATQDRATRIIGLDKAIRGQYNIGKYSTHLFFGGKTFENENYKSKVWTYFKDYLDIVSYIIMGKDNKGEVLDYMNNIIEDLLI